MKPLLNPVKVLVDLAGFELELFILGDIDPQNLQEIKNYVKKTAKHCNKPKN
jgi:hypothetical protein